MLSRSELKQNWLSNYENPLTKRFGRRYFSTLPETPGVYRFYGRHAGEDGVLLYVGKAKNLRIRLNSYRRAKPEQVARKILWMLWQIQGIEFETCSTERAALLRENELLREFRPPFNVLNTTPENYVALVLCAGPEGIRLSWTQDLRQRREGEELYGVFRSRAAVRDALGALLRLCWMGSRADDDSSRYEIPAKLLRYRPPNPYTIELEPIGKWHRLIHRFLAGHSPALLRALTQDLLEKASIPAWFYPRVQEDLEVLSGFYKQYCRRNCQLCRYFGRAGPFIAQNEIDDWIAVFKSKAGSGRT